jgi:hypothetical protein
VDETMIQMAETMASNNDDLSELQKNLGAVETCSGLSRNPPRVQLIIYFNMQIPEGMDECDTAALVYQCGQEKAPDLVANAISTAEFNSSVV